MTTLITGALVYDGSGSLPFSADVAFDKGVISAVGPDLDRTSAEIVDGTGLALAPGFIDFHTHADFTYPAFPDSAHSISQGVTTEVVGNCGSSPAPLSADADMRRQFQELKRELGPDLEWTWTTFAEYLAALDDARPAVNCVPLVGHSAVRAAVVGMDEREPSPAELSEMKALVDSAMSVGAWGMSTGLVYPPSSYGQPAEVHELARRVGDHGGIYATHMRDEGAALTAAVTEAIEVARAADVKVEISHLKSSGIANHGRIGEALDLIDAARESGLEVGFDAYPYVASSTGLSQLLPAWALVGGVSEIVARLGSTEMRARISAEMTADKDNYLNGAGGWPGVMISNVEEPSLSSYRGRIVSGLAAELRIDPAELVFDVIAGDRATSTMIAFTMSEHDVGSALDHPAGVVGSDLLVVTSPTAHVHPRAYGSFARVMARGAARGEVELADAIRRCTSLPAARLGLSDRGEVKPGTVADLVLFDPARIHDRATFENPTLLADGVSHVWLAGEPAIADGEPQNLRLGRVLRKGIHADGP